MTECKRSSVHTTKKIEGQSVAQEKSSSVSLSLKKEKAHRIIFPQKCTHGCLATAQKILYKPIRYYDY